MVTENKDLMAQAREVLKGRWTLPVCATLVYMVIIGALSCIPFVGSVATLIIGGPFMLGLLGFYMAVSHKQDAKLEMIFDGFKRFVPALVLYILMVVAIMIGFILLIVPGIILAFGLSLSFLILLENPEMSAIDVLKKSWNMMNGYKMKYFFLSLRFIGWALLCILTLGIGFLWLMPYVQVTFIKFYEDLKANGAGVATV